MYSLEIISVVAVQAVPSRTFNAACDVVLSLVDSSAGKVSCHELISLVNASVPPSKAALWLDTVSKVCDSSDCEANKLLCGEVVIDTVVRLMTTSRPTVVVPLTLVHLVVKYWAC